MNQQNKLFKVAAAQITPAFLDKTETTKRAVDTIIEAGKNGVKLVVFPEVFIAGYPDWMWLIPNYKGAELNKLYSELLDNAVSIPDSTTDLLCEAAKKVETNVVIGMHERNTEASNASLFNTILFISENGEILGKHRKLIPTGGERLIWAQGEGSDLKSFQSSAGCLGGLICWENYMPLARQTLYNQGVQVLAAPTWDKSENWQLSMRHIAREGGCYVISCCMALGINDIPDKYEFKKLYPEGREWINAGNSCIINPKGEIISGPVSEKKEIIYADVDLSLINESKRLFDSAGHYSRPDVFTLKVKTE